MNSLYHVSQKKGCVSIHPKVEMVFNFYPAKTKQAYYSFQVGGLLETRRGILSFRMVSYSPSTKSILESRFYCKVFEDVHLLGIFQPLIPINCVISVGDFFFIFY